MTTHPVRTVLVGMLAAAAVLALQAPVGAQDSGTSTGSVDVQAEIRSITVSPGTFSFAQCSRSGGEATTALTFPNGTCSLGGAGVTIDNGAAPAHIHVRATDFTASAGGTPWTLVDGTPGVDQAQLSLIKDRDAPMVLATTNRCDTTWAPGTADPCAAGPNVKNAVEPVMIGPSNTTNASTTFSTTITWTALP